MNGAPNSPSQIAEHAAEAGVCIPVAELGILRELLDKQERNCDSWGKISALAVSIEDWIVHNADVAFQRGQQWTDETEEDYQLLVGVYEIVSTECKKFSEVDVTGENDARRNYYQLSEHMRRSLNRLLHSVESLDEVRSALRPDLALEDIREELSEMAENVKGGTISDGDLTSLRTTVDDLGDLITVTSERYKEYSPAMLSELDVLLSDDERSDGMCVLTTLDKLIEKGGSRVQETVGTMMDDIRGFRAQLDILLQLLLTSESAGTHWRELYLSLGKMQRDMLRLSAVAQLPAIDTQVTQEIFGCAEAALRALRTLLWSCRERCSLPNADLPNPSIKDE